MGHMMLPCSKPRTGANRSSEVLTFVKGEFFQSQQSAAPSSTPGGVARTEHFDIAGNEAATEGDPVYDAQWLVGKFRRQQMKRIRSAQLRDSSSS